MRALQRGVEPDVLRFLHYTRVNIKIRIPIRHDNNTASTCLSFAMLRLCVPRLLHYIRVNIKIRIPIPHDNITASTCLSFAVLRARA
jgi:hypothetical protein